VIAAEAVPFALGKRLDDLTTVARNPLLTVGVLLAPPGGHDAAGGGDAARSNAPMLVAGLLSARPVSLDTPVTSDASVAAIPIASWEGREIYRRSASRPC
jgi:hypothetical protein